MVTCHERSPRFKTAKKKKERKKKEGGVVCVGGGASEYYPHPIMISIITLTTLMDIKIVCDMVI